MNSNYRFEISLKERNLENLAPPHDDPLGELSAFELGIRKFCYEYDYKVLVKVGNEEYFVFLDPDICMILEDNLPQLIANLVIGKAIELDFVESHWIVIKFVPIGNDIECYLREFGYSTDEILVMLNKQQVLDELRRFLTELMELAFNLGYISLEDKNEFIKPAFC
ncbi:MAG: hypothetical protein F6K10_00435 [Moorea sp. SIO2B7]|nr:hypothetical protein [Moorena sp. SIO2B7]